ncbi:hypothetical protein [Psychromonas sp. Urea-02u-13]|uniref:hypothetical protein n=1 Tax=Psychromonas sp. Urea-02u-13 TaxID=2058326 RepID=UPI000C33A84E|nr:hypothetical protein [Psychromonas sp. Urea-02u-13]PKG37081.1 hypothetical protein CXF74_20760 [Psychromonas sp. Urea-02u-13]
MTVMVKIGDNIKYVSKQKVQDTINSLQKSGGINRDQFENLHDKMIANTQLGENHYIAAAAVYAVVFSVDVMDVEVKWIIITTCQTGRVAIHGGQQADIDFMRSELDALESELNKK